MEPRRLEVRSPDGDKGLFLAVASSGFVTGPISGPWTDDRLTVALEPEGDFKMVHRSIGPAEVWRHTPVTLQAEMDSFLRNNISKVGWAELTGARTYLISVYRRGALVSSLLDLFEIPMMFLLRHLLVRSGSKGKEFVFDGRKIEHLARSIQLSPVPILLKLVGRLPPKVWLSMGRGAFRFFSVDATNHERVMNDICFLVSPNRIGVVLPSKDGLADYLPAEAVIQALARIEGSLPFGRLGELSQIMKPGVTFKIN